ncbi:MAG TPA: glycosyltransferase 87 family protein [Candidatus Acidoferrum sp.]|nr:glycosyltransferase 87 family protein [Candidatus Acidoferrum sp.]
MRLVFAPFTAYQSDMAVLYRAINDLLRGFNIYTTNSFSYPPLWAYIEYPFLDLVSVLTSPNVLGVATNTLVLPLESWELPTVITSPLFNLLSKIPLFIADLLIGIIIYDIVRESGKEKEARFSFILWFFNPLVIYIDSIHGQFDVLPALMTVLSFCLFYKRKYLASGIALGLGTLFKIYPIFLAPLYLFTAARLEKGKSGRAEESVKQIFVSWSKFIGGMSLSFFVFLIPLINSNIIHDVFSRTILTSLGGLTLFNIAYVPGLQWVLPYIAGRAGLASVSLEILLVALILLISLSSFLSHRDSLETFILGHIAVLVAIYLTSFTVNPQYILWILPFLVLSYGLYHRNLKNLFLISLSALVFLIGVAGPLYYFYPAAVYAQIIGVGSVYANANFFKNGGGSIVLLISGIAGVIGLFSCLTGTFASLLGSAKPQISSKLSQKESQPSGVKISLEMRKWTVNPSKVLMFIFIFLLIGQVLAFAQPLVQQNVSFSTVYVESQLDNRVGIGYNIRSGSYPVDLQVFATPATSGMNETANKAVFIYYDDAYPSSFVTRAGWAGFLDHAPVELRLRGYKGSIEIVNADELRSVMEQDYDSVIIIPSGVFPETVHSNNESIVHGWLEAGGTLIWIGDAFAYLTGLRNGSIEHFSGNNFTQVQDQILGFAPIGEPSEQSEFATIQSGFSSALDLQYPDASMGALISEVERVNGLVLGETTNSTDARTSISSLPVGAGHLLLFGGGIGTVFTATGEDVIAHDIAQMLCSGYPFSSGVFASSSYELAKNEVKASSLDVPMPQDQNITGVMIVVFSKSPYDQFFTQEVYPFGYQSFPQY